ncbi:pseudouridine synthase [Gottschalkia purinilytica]|uniref:Pseudouridine synthase n=1 Tax=Gottschalkia purinilytica TaxID=1503 RepID=A0A0L0W7J4_GOTPU|nr:pseudouridine synthase [Gottschalkia purinilytica]KNF07436.1 pseudouridine synthase [Gottschalkia purinilytica]
MRLQKFMAQCGVASRRKSEELILQGKVKVNGIVINELGFKIDPINDNVMVNNRKIEIEKNKVYIALNKPTGYVTTLSDELGRKKVIDLVKNINERIYPIGRLDYDTSGLLLLTNDGELAYKLTHPKHEITKRYVADIKGIPTREELRKFKSGLNIDGYITAEANIKILNSNKDSSTVEIEIHEGRNRQVRKMCDKIGHPVITLKRVSIGSIKLKDLRLGKWRFLTEQEIEYLKEIK